jgi:hypothetical protein
MQLATIVETDWILVLSIKLRHRMQKILQMSTMLPENGSRQSPKTKQVYVSVSLNGSIFRNFGFSLPIGREVEETGTL